MGAGRRELVPTAEIQPGPGEADVRKSLVIYIGCLAALWLIALAVVGIRSAVFHCDYPYNTLLFIPARRFTDFTIFYPRFRVFGDPKAFFSPDGYPFTYPAPLLVCFLFLWRFFREPLVAYLALICSFACLVGAVALKALPNRPGLRKFAAVAVLAAAIFSFPLFYLFDRANLEGFVWVASAIGLYCFTTRRYYFAAVFLASATSMKIFPGVLLLLFIAKQRYRELALSVISYGAFTLASLWVTGPSIGEANRGIAMGIDYFLRNQILQFRALQIGFDHSVFSLIKWVTFFSVDDIPELNDPLPKLYIPYAVAALLGFGALYGLRLRRMPVLNQVLALSAISVTLPYVSYEYSLVHLIVPFILFVLFLTRDVASEHVVLKKSQILAILLPFVLIFAPMSFLILIHGVGFGGQIKALALVYLVGVTLKVRCPSSLFGELETGS
jgi:hypothetical protein